MEDIEDEESKHHFVKLVNPYGIHGSSFPLFQEDDLSHDVTMVSGDGTLMTCHAPLLAASIPYLADLLEEAFKDDENILIVSQNITAQQMKNLMNFLYGGKLVAKKGEVDDMKIVLEEFQISYNVDIIKNSCKDVQRVEDVTEVYIDKVDTAPQTNYIYKDKKIKERVQRRLRRRKRMALSYDNWRSACDYCDIKSKSIRGTMKHVQNDHPDLFDKFAKIHIKTQCEYCDQKFLDQKLLYQHKKSHIQKHLSGTDKPFPCDACETKFSRSYDLTIHKKRHKILQTPLLCNQCESSFHTQFDYKKHNRDHIEARREKEKVYRPVPVALDPNFSAICSTCGKTYTTYAAYNHHIKNAHVDKELLKCPHCATISSSFGNLKKHMKLHLPPTLQCEHCQKQFPTRNYLKKHTRSQHLADNQKKFVCSKCGKGFNLKSSYIGHMNMHAGLKPFKCRHCEMSYQNGSNRNAHERNRHPHDYAKTTHHRAVKIS